MNYLLDADVSCPYCSETIHILIDTSAGNQQYVEDCQVCCSPILLSTQINESTGQAEVFAEQENA